MIPFQEKLCTVAMCNSMKILKMARTLYQHNDGDYQLILYFTDDVEHGTPDNVILFVIYYSLVN